MPHRENINIVKQSKRMTDLFAFGEFWRRLSHLGKFNTCQWHSACTKFGHSNNFATLPLSLSGARLYIRETVTPIILRAGRPRQYTDFLASMQEKSDCFLSPSNNCGGCRFSLG